LFQVLLNLVKNAVEAIEVSAKPERLITLQTFQDVSETRLIVHDSGDGIAEENLNRVFHFGFTTKSKGTGHGLHSVANFMDACQGKIEVASSAEAGTSFILVFPRLEPLAADVSE
jgi:C4-dicarboxylate-specific signal transduction histidine kinase